MAATVTIPAAIGLAGDPPPWVAQTTGVSAGLLVYWRRKGWLGARPGSGRRFDWTAALDQIAWLDQLHRWGKTLDGEDAAGGWRLRERPQTLRAVRVEGGRWEPFHLHDTLPAGRQFFVATIPARTAQR